MFNVLAKFQRIGDNSENVIVCGIFSADTILTQCIA